MDIKAVGNLQASIQSHAQSAEVVGREAQKVQQAQEGTMQQPDQQTRQPSAEELASVMKDIQEKLNAFNGELKIMTDEESGVQVVKIVETQTDKVIRQIPSESVLKIAQYLDEIAGLLYNEKV